MQIKSANEQVLSPLRAVELFEPLPVLRHSELRELLSARRGAQIVTLTAVTDARLRKTGNPLAMPVLKVSRVNGIVNWNYQLAVVNQQLREGSAAPEFQPEPRAWGTRIPDSPFVEHKGNLYLELKVERSLGHNYRDSNGGLLDAAVVQPFLPAKRSNAEHQGVEREVVLRDYALSSIDQITVGGVSYQVALD
jgi:hypothetical protein